MTDIPSGIPVVKLAAWTFVPAAGAVLAGSGLKSVTGRWAVTVQRLREAGVS